MKILEFMLPVSRKPEGVPLRLPQHAQSLGIDASGDYPVLAFLVDENHREKGEMARTLYVFESTDRVPSQDSMLYAGRATVYDGKRLYYFLSHPVEA